MTNNSITEKILSDAQEKATAILKESQEKAGQAVAQANAEAREQKKNAESQASLKLPELKRRAISVAELEVKKMALAARQEVLGVVFDRALDKLVSMDDEKYLALIRSMIKAVASDGDVVVVGKIDKGRITKGFIDKVAKEAGIALSLSSVYGDFKGGVVLQSKGCDKNMSFEVEMEALRQDIEPKVSAKLF